jgi:hypothetical protein
VKRKQSGFFTSPSREFLENWMPRDSAAGRFSIVVGKLTSEVRIVIKDTITQIEARIEKTESLDDAKKRELLDLLSTLKIEVSDLSKTHPEQTESITGFAGISIHEAMREEKNPQLLKLSLHGLSTSVEGFESSHPKLVGVVNSICLTLSNIGI